MRLAQNEAFRGIRPKIKLLKQSKLCRRDFGRKKDVKYSSGTEDVPENTDTYKNGVSKIRVFHRGICQPCVSPFLANMGSDSGHVVHTWRCTRRTPVRPHSRIRTAASSAMPLCREEGFDGAPRAQPKVGYPSLPAAASCCLAGGTNRRTIGGRLSHLNTFRIRNFTRRE